MVCIGDIRTVIILFFTYGFIFFTQIRCFDAPYCINSQCAYRELPKIYKPCAASWKRNTRCTCSRLSRFVDTLTSDVIDFHRNIGTTTTLKILAATVPFYLVTRPADNMVHDIFYCKHCHKNLRQPPRGLTNFLNYAVPSAMVGLSCLTFSSHEDLAVAGRVFGISLPFVWLEKNILKKMFKFDGCKRPFNQHFPRKCVYGGCPSGHMVFSWYATIFWGLQQGITWGLPMGIFSTAVLIDFIVSNRHYASQMVLGAALGIIYGFAGSKAVDCIRNLPIECAMTTTTRGNPAVEFSFSY